MREGVDIKTGLISIGEFADRFTEYLLEKQDVLYFPLSRNISGNYNSACLGAEMAMEEAGNGYRVRIIDTMNASLGQGILAIYAGEMRQNGMDFYEVTDILEKYPSRMNGVFTVGNLKYLSKTGRISNSKAFVGNALNVKPILRGNSEGYIVLHKIHRGRKKALNQLVDYLLENIVDPENQIIGIAHADSYEESRYVMDKIQDEIVVRRFINTSYDFCTGTHVGPDTIALFFMGKDRELEGR